MISTYRHIKKQIGGLGVIGGVGFTPRILKLTIKHLKKDLKDPNAPFGVDLLLPKVGSGARKTNYDYTKGKLDQLIDVIIESGAKLFVSAVGVPPKQVVDKLHKAGIPVMNMIGHPKHVKYALKAGQIIYISVYYYPCTNHHDKIVTIYRCRYYLRSGWRRRRS